MNKPGHLMLLTVTFEAKTKNMDVYLNILFTIYIGVLVELTSYNEE